MSSFWYTRNEASLGAKKGNPVNTVWESTPHGPIWPIRYTNNNNKYYCKQYFLNNWKNNLEVFRGFINTMKISKKVGKMWVVLTEGKNGFTVLARQI